MTQPIAGAAISGSLRSQRYAIVLAVLLLGVPLAASALRASENMGSLERVEVSERQATGGDDLPALEERARTAPTADNRLGLSVGYIRANLPAQAIPILLGLVAEDRNNSRAWNNLCVAHNQQSAFREGVAACTEALRIDPGFQLAANNLKWAMDEQQKSGQQDAPMFPLAQGPTVAGGQDAASLLARGLAQLNRGEYDSAIASWERSLERDPTNAVAANNIGTAYMFKKQTSGALAWFQHAVQLDPTLQIARNNLAWAANEQRKELR